MNTRSSNPRVGSARQILTLPVPSEDLVLCRRRLVAEIQEVDTQLLRAKQDRYREFKDNHEAARWKRGMIDKKIRKEKELGRLRREISNRQASTAQAARERLDAEGIDPTNAVSIIYNLLGVIETFEGFHELEEDERTIVSVGYAYLEGQGVYSRS